MPTTTTTRDIAARLVALSAAEWPALFARFPNGLVGSQLEHCLEGHWYRHEGALTLRGDYVHTFNLVVDGDFTVEGTIDDSSGPAVLVVMGDVRCANLLSEHLIVIAGSLYCGGLVHAHYNDWNFEVWGSTLEARSLVVTDRLTILPENRATSHEYDSESGDGPEPEEFDVVRRRIRAGKPAPVPSAAPSIRVELRRAKCPAGALSKALGDPALHLDLASSPAASVGHLDALSASEDARVLVAAASHPRTRPVTLSALARHSDPRVRAAAAHHGKLPGAAAAALAADPVTAVRVQFAAGPWASLALDALVTDPEARVRRAIGSHPGLSDEHRRRLLNDPDEAVSRRALNYLPASPEWVAELLQSQREILLAWAIERSGHQAAPAGGWRKQMEQMLDPRRKVREAALKQMPVNRDLFAFLDEHRDTFLKDESPLFRRTLASVSRDAATIAALAADRDELVRRDALSNLAAPESLLVSEAKRLCAAPASRWSFFDSGYMDHMHAVSALMAHPRLPAKAITEIHRVHPRSPEMEPHRNTPFAVIVERAEPWADQWRDAVKWSPARLRAIYAEMLESDEKRLVNAARVSSITPMKALLNHARSCDSDSGLEKIASNPGLAGNTQDAADLIRFLLAKEDRALCRALLRNPDLPAAVVREIASVEPEAAKEAALAMWQVRGEGL